MKRTIDYHTVLEDVQNRIEELKAVEQAIRVLIGVDADETPHKQIPHKQKRSPRPKETPPAVLSPGGASVPPEIVKAIQQAQTNVLAITACLRYLGEASPRAIEGLYDVVGRHYKYSVIGVEMRRMFQLGLIQPVRTDTSGKVRSWKLKEADNA